MEPPEVRRFLRQELLKKVGYSWWNRPRVYRHDRDDEREPTPSLCSVVVVPSGQEQTEESLDQQELGPAVSGDLMTLVGQVASLVTSLPHTPGRDIVVAGSTEESPRTREGRLAAATLEQEMGRCSVAEAIRPIRERAVASSSSAERAITREMVAEACDTQPPHPCGPRVAGFQQRTSQQGRERPESWQILPSRSGSWRRRPDPRGTDPREEPSGSRSQPCPALAQSSDRSSHRPCAPTCPRLSHQRVMRATSQAQRKIHRTLGRDLPRTSRGTRKRRSSIKRRLEGRNHHRLNWS